MVKYIALITFVISLTNMEKCFCQTGWTLERCIEFGLENNLDVALNRNGYNQSRNRYYQSWLELLPAVNSTTSWAIHPKKEITSTLEVSIPIFKGLSNLYNIYFQHSARTIAGYAVSASMDQLRLSITEAYLNVLLAQERLNMAKRNFSVIEEQYEKSLTLFQNGKGTYSSLLEIEYQKSSEKGVLISSENELSIQIISLKQLMNLTSSEDFFIIPSDVDSITAPPVWNNTEVLYRNSLSLPHIRMAEQSVQQSIYHSRSMAGLLLPSVALIMGYDMINNIYGIALSITIPIIDRGIRVTDIKNTTLNIEKAEIELEQRRQSLSHDIQIAVQETEGYYQQYLSSKDQVNSASEAFRIIQERFNLGMCTTFDYTHSRNNLYKAQSELLQAKYRYIFQLKVIEFYKGEMGR